MLSKTYFVFFYKRERNWGNKTFLIAASTWIIQQLSKLLFSNNILGLSEIEYRVLNVRWTLWSWSNTSLELFFEFLLFIQIVSQATLRWKWGAQSVIAVSMSQVCTASRSAEKFITCLDKNLLKYERVRMKHRSSSNTLQI